MQNSDLSMSRSAGEQSTSNKESTAPCTVGTANNVSNTNSAQSLVGAGWTISAAGPSTTSEEKDKQNVIHIQLIRLMHAYLCRIHDTKSKGEVRPCTLHCCSTMKQVLVHMETCQAGKSCTVPDCFSSSQMIQHWKHCVQIDCPVCVPLKLAFLQKELEGEYAVVGLPYESGVDGGNVNAMLQSSQEVQGLNITGDQGPHCSSQDMGHFQALQPAQQQSQLHLRPVLQGNNANVIPSSNAQNFLMNDNFQSKSNLTNVTLLNPQNQVIPGIMNDSVFSAKDWHQSVEEDLRQHLIQKIVKSIFPTMDANMFRDSRMIKAVAYAEKLENEIYVSAISKEEYYQLLAEKIYNIQLTKIND